MASCERTSQFDTPRHVEEVMDGWLTIPPWGRARIGTGNIDWQIDPFDHPTWRFYFRSMHWVLPLVQQSRQTGNPVYRARAEAILKDWRRDNPRSHQNSPQFTWDVASTALRANVLMCVEPDFRGQAWLTDWMKLHAAHLAGKWDGAWNHGLMGDNALLRLGCLLSDRRSSDLARHRMAAAFEPNRLGPAIDTQGVPNEQSIGYAILNYELWRMAENHLTRCGYPIPPRLAARRPLIPTLLAHATQPDGRLAQLGDTYDEPTPTIAGTHAEYAASQGKSGPRPRGDVKVYSGGYVFGRSGWGTARSFQNESFYSARFGRARQVHGHNDHMSVTYYARRGGLLVDSGHVGYKSGAYRTYLQSRSAHNVQVMPRAGHAASSTALVRRVVDPDAQFFQFSDNAYKSRSGMPITRRRGLFVSQQPDLMIVDDRPDPGTSRYQQLWHLSPRFTVRHVGRDFATATAGDTDLRLLQVPLPGQDIPPGSTRVVEGATNPYQGWVSHRQLHRSKAPVVSMYRTAKTRRTLTVIAPLANGRSMRAVTSRRSDRAAQLTVTLGRQAHRFRVGDSGLITRL